MNPSGFARVLFPLVTTLAAASPVWAGNIYLTGHDVDNHLGQGGYDNVILDFLRAKGTALEFPMAQYKIAVVGSGVGSWGWSDAAFGVVQKPGYGTTTYYNTSTLTTAAAWAAVLSNDCLMINSQAHDLNAAGVAAITAFSAQIRAAFDGGMDIWANSSAGDPLYYSFLPATLFSNGPGLAGTPSGPFVPTAVGVNIGITPTMVNCCPTHNTFTTISPAMMVMETFESPGHAQDHSVISLAAHNLTFNQPCPMPTRSRVTASTTDGYVGADVASIPVPERAAFSTYVGTSRSFDQGGVDAPLGHSFINLPGGIMTATLRIRMRPEDASGGENNDLLALQFDDSSSTFAWTRRLGNQGTILGLKNYAWSFGSTSPVLFPNGALFELDLANLTQQSGPTVNLISSLNIERHLDIYIQDDTNVDWIELVLGTCPCVEPPKSMVAWYQFDQPTVASPDEPDAAGGTLASRNGATRVLGSYVGDCLFFADTNPDSVQVKNGAENNFGNRSFSIDAWVRLGSVSGIRTIVDKRSFAGTGTIGYRFYVLNGYLGCTLADAALSGETEYQSTDPAAAAKLVNVNWHHVAMTVERVTAPMLVTLYQDGKSIAQFSALGKMGSVTNSNSALIGNGYYVSGSANPYGGLMDEVEFFNRALAPKDVQALHGAGRNGKCKEGCYLSYPYLTLGGQYKAQLLICNFSSSPQIYNWSVLGSATGPGCNVSGALLAFTPASGTLTVPARKCVPVYIAVNTSALTCTDRACFAATVTNVNLAQSCICTAAAYPVCYVDPDVSPPYVGLVGAPGSLPPFPVSFGLMNTGWVSGPTLGYELQVVDSGDGLPSESVSLNGLPPGTAVTGSLSLPVGGAATIPATVEFVEYDAFAVQELQLRADLDGDGVREVIATMPLLSNPAADCNANGNADQEELLAGATDCDQNGVLDGCDPDCNANLVPDACDLASATSADCNGNAIPDECDISSALSLDCNANTVPDDCDIATASSQDSNGNGIPDECEVIAPGSSFCFGDGSLADHTTACPCGNNGLAGNGCAHSFSSDGANIAANGSVAADTVQLVSSNEPPTSFTLFLQHSAPGDTVFFDGVLCAGGTLIRLRGRAATGGVASFPDPSFDSTITLSQRGGVTIGSGAVRYYSAWYRNASAVFCPPATANVTNGWTITW